jgi:hypothetical protein
MGDTSERVAEILYPAKKIYSTKKYFFVFSLFSNLVEYNCGHTDLIGEAGLEQREPQLRTQGEGPFLH